MSRIVSALVKDEFSEFLGLLKRGWAIGSLEKAKFFPELRSLHKKHLALCCASRVLRGKGRHRVFISQLPENAFLAFVFALKGMENPCCVQLRQMLELTLKHIFFDAHPVEYGWVCTQDGLREYGFQSLIEYAQRLEPVSKVNEIKLFDSLNRLFSETSRYVHVHSSKFFSPALRSMKRAEIESAFGIFRRIADEIFPAILLLLAVNNPDRYVASSAAEKKIILAGLTTTEKAFLAKFLRELSLR